MITPDPPLTGDPRSTRSREQEQTEVVSCSVCGKTDVSVNPVTGRVQTHVANAIESRKHCKGSGQPPRVIDGETLLDLGNQRLGRVFAEREVESLRAQLATGDSERSRVQQENERLTKELARAQQLHDATCFTRPKVEAADKLRSTLAQVIAEMRTKVWAPASEFQGDDGLVAKWADQLALVTREDGK